MTDVIEDDLAPWVEHYAHQVHLYARHWAAMAGQRVTRAGLLFTRPNRPVWLPCSVARAAQHSRRGAASVARRSWSSRDWVKS